MKIGILGAGSIGKMLARKLATAGHDVTIANSRGPETIAPEALETGARAALAEDALADVEVAILSMPWTGFEKAKPVVAALPASTVLIDTSNYMPLRDGENPEIEAGRIESEWVQDYFAHRVVKAWNAIASEAFAHLGRDKGHSERIAIPVAGDDAHGREVACALVEDAGLDAYDAGTLAESWRQQPGSPVYCTDLSYEEIAPALAAAERDRLPKRRDLAIAVFADRVGPWSAPDAELGRRVSRALFM